MFTRHTVNSIIANAKIKPTIVLINNGWAKGAIPIEVLGLWNLFITEFLMQGKIDKVINLDHSTNLVLDAYQIAENDCRDDFYFISDNDCIVNTPGFDETLLSAANKYELNKLGIDFYRTVSLEYCAQFPSIQDDLDVYYRDINLSRNLVKSGSESTYCQVTNREEFEIFPGSQITNNATDTTLSIVRRGNAVNQNSANRISPSIKNIEMLHVGYLEGNFNSRNSLETIEMLVYAKNRSNNMTEFKDDYLNRFLVYSSLIERENKEIFNFFKFLTKH